MAHRALLLVDLQNDFCAGGALAVPEGDSTVDVANALIDWSWRAASPSSPARTGIRRITAVSPASTRWNPTPRASWTAWRKLSGRITACSTAKARRCILCSSSRRSPLCSTKGKTGASTAIALSLTTVTGRKPNWTAGCVVRDRGADRSRPRHRLLR